MLRKSVVGTATFAQSVLEFVLELTRNFYRMFTHFKNILPRTINKYNLYRTFEAAKVCKKYEKAATEILGDEGLRNARPLYCKNNVLFIKVKNSGWANEVYQKRAELLRSINEGLDDKEKIEEIRTRIKQES